MKKLENFNIVQLEEFFNSLLSDSTYISHEQRDVRYRMIDIIEKNIDKKYKLNCSSTLGSTFSIIINGIRVEFKVSVKSTGNETRVGRKIKLIKGFGKVKFNSAGRNLLSINSYILDEKGLPKLSGYGSSSKFACVSFEKTDLFKFSEMLNRVTIDYKVDKDSLYKEIVNSMSQPYYKENFRKFRNDDKTIPISSLQLPRNLKNEMPNDATAQELFELIPVVVGKVFKKEILEVIEEMYEIT